MISKVTPSRVTTVTTSESITTIATPHRRSHDFVSKSLKIKTKKVLYIFNQKEYKNKSGNSEKRNEFCLFISQHMLEGWFHLVGPQFVTLSGKMNMVWDVQIFDFVTQGGFKEDGKIEPVDAFVVSETLNQFVDFMNFSVQLFTLTWKNRKKKNLGIGHFLVDFIKNGVDAFGNSGSVVLVNIVGS